MNNQKSWFDILKFKVIGALISGVVLYFGSGLLGFPPVFQAMFAFYALLGLIVFILLDMPPMKPLTGVKAFIGIAVFFILCSAVLTATGMMLPQFDPEWEKGKIKKILDRRIEKFSRTTVFDLYSKSELLTSKANTLLVRLESLEAGSGPSIEIPEGGFSTLNIKEMTPDQLIAYGREVYDLYECYNCHKLKGKGGAKKRGPELDNVGNVMDIELMKKKIWDPTIGYTEGFLEEHEEETMPDNYDELMDEGELHALVTWMATLKDTRYDTPKHILHDHSKH